jgi:PAS domain S-box-containing protein
LYIFSALGFVLVGLSIILSVLFGHTFKKDISERNLRLAESIARQVEVSLNHHGVELWRLSHDIMWEKLDDSAAQNSMDRILNYHTLIERIYLLDKAGRVIRVAPENEQLVGLDMSRQPYFRERIRDGNQVQWHDSYLTSEFGRRTVVMCVSHREGTLVAHINLNALEWIVKSENPLSDGFITILDSKGVAITSPDHKMDTSGIHFAKLTSVKNALGGIEGSYEEKVHGESGLSSATLIQEMGWAVLVFQHGAGTFGAVNRLINFSILIPLLALIAALLISLRLLKKIMSPLQNLIGQTKNVAAGGYNVSVKSRYTELEELVESFNHMARAIEAREDELRASESRYRELFYNNPLPAMIFDAVELDILDVSQAAVEDYGYSREEFIGMSVIDIRPEEDVARLKEHISKRPPGRDKAGIIRHRKKDGTVIFVDIISHEILFKGRRSILAICRDITSSVLVEEALRDSQERLRATLESIGDAIIILDLDMNVTWANKLATDNIGYFVEEKCYFAVNGTQEKCRDCAAVKSLRNEKTYRTEMQINAPDGTERNYFVNTAPMYDRWGQVMGVVKSLKDITEMKRSEKLLIQSLAEKEVLFKEVHHRVKNNLQAISGLIDMQAHSTSDLWTKKVLQDSQNRIASMALIHEKLYEMQGLDRVDLGDYVDSLIGHLANIYKIREKGVEVNVSHEKILLNVDTALPCGLIITELVSNSFKHAFPENGGGRIDVQLSTKGMDQFVITIEDDGIGFKNDLNGNENNSLGLNLVQSYVEFLSGDLEVPQDGASRFRVTFREYEECPVNEL